MTEPSARTVDAGGTRRATRPTEGSTRLGWSAHLTQGSDVNTNATSDRPRRVGDLYQQIVEINQRLREIDGEYDLARLPIELKQEWDTLIVERHERILTYEEVKERRNVLHEIDGLALALPRFGTYWREAVKP